MAFQMFPVSLTGLMSAELLQAPEKQVLLSILKGGLHSFHVTVWLFKACSCTIYPPALPHPESTATPMIQRWSTTHFDTGCGIGLIDIYHKSKGRKISIFLHLELSCSFPCSMLEHSTAAILQA
ncbi:hypothetical protein GGR54DRAFT_587872 [Hypoxylon sp. NC1633]|nr:hypothetical protein GGR54DRAFT_587872 [Hypoxylon sp. NC1633]